MFAKMKEYEIGWFATVISPIVISNCMLKRYLEILMQPYLRVTIVLSQY